MASSLVTEQLIIGGMTCINCQNKIEKKLRNLAGVKKAKVSWTSGIAEVTYNAGSVSKQQLRASVRQAGYTVLNKANKSSPGRVVGILVIIFALYMVLQHFGILNLLIPSQLAETNMSYGMLFVIGLITSVHCVAMCGGITLSQCIPKEDKTGIGKSGSAIGPALYYNIGRVVSYTLVGFIVGALGSVISLSNTFQGILKLIAGLLMVIMGINMLGIMPFLRRLVPHMPKIFAQKIDTEKQRNRSPLYIGLLNGLMPCGPLQAMQIYALSSGNAFTGAFSMFLFALGTVPLMFGLGALSTALGRKFSRGVMAVGAILVVVLGMSMFTQGMGLSGVQMPDLSVLTRKNTAGNSTENVAPEPIVTGQDGVQEVRSVLEAGRYPTITVGIGTPVRWIIDAPQSSINGCNGRMILQEYGIEHTFVAGENIITFTPVRSGSFQYTCWMGMIRGTIIVTK